MLTTTKGREKKVRGLVLDYVYIVKEKLAAVYSQPYKNCLVKS